MQIGIRRSKVSVPATALFCLIFIGATPQAHSQNAPVYKVDPFWPKRLPNN